MSNSRTHLPSTILSSTSWIEWANALFNWFNKIVFLLFEGISQESHQISIFRKPWRKLIPYFILIDIEVPEASFSVNSGIQICFLSTTHFSLRMKSQVSFIYTKYLSDLDNFSVREMCSPKSQLSSGLACEGKWGSAQGGSGLFHQVILLKLHGTSRNVKEPRHIEMYFLILSNNGINHSWRGFDRRKNQLSSLVMP